MPRTFRSLITFLILIIPIQSQAQFPEDWKHPFPGHKVIANLYAVGTYGLSVFLITSDEGHILINTGLEDSTPIIKNNIESLGFKLEDVKILLVMQAHFDHTAAFAEIKAMTGAKMWTTAEDAPFMEDGGFSDPQFGGEAMFKPVRVDKFIKDGEVITLGEIELLVHEHPGHTQGSTSFSMQVEENGKDYNVAIVNMGTINTGKKLIVDPTYPGVSDDFAKTYEKQKAMEIDVWVAAHGSQYGLHDKYTPGQEYSPETFVDPEGFFNEVNRLEMIYKEHISKEMR